MVLTTQLNSTHRAGENWFVIGAASRAAGRKLIKKLKIYKKR